MFDVRGDTGVVGIAQTKLAMNDLKIGPTTATDVSIHMHSTGYLTSLTRQSGGDFILRNYGSGRIVMRPGDNPANDITFGQGYEEFVEIADPANPGTDRGRLFVRDNGAGKTQLCVKFNTGSTIVIATQA